MCQKDADRMAKSVDPDQAGPDLGAKLFARPVRKSGIISECYYHK